MIKLGFNKIENPQSIHLDCSDDYIPFSITIGNPTPRPETIYTRNLSGENFIEFWFNKDNKYLYEVTLVAIQNDSIKEVETIEIMNKDNILYNCLLENDDDSLEFSQPVNIYRSKDSINLSWALDENTVSHFFLSENIAIGVDPNNHMVSIVLTSLSVNEISDIFGF